MKKKPILLLQFRTDKSRKHEIEQIMEKGDFKVDELKVVNVLDRRYKVPKASELNKYSAIITGASGQFNVTDWSKEIENRVKSIYPFIRQVIKQDFPLLAICFGHQLIAHIMEGKVESDSMQEEAGTFKITLTNLGRKSKLFAGIPKQFYVVEGHKDSVTKLAEGARLLAYSDRALMQACLFKQNIYSVQFHPELDRDGLTWRLSLYPVYMRGRSISEIKSTYKEIPYASKIIKNFRKIVQENNLQYDKSQK